MIRGGALRGTPVGKGTEALKKDLSQSQKEGGGG